MPTPVECPACGHPRILKRPREPRTEPAAALQRHTRWACGLCRYEWSLPARSGPDDWDAS